MKKSKGPAVHKGGSFPVEQELGKLDKDMTPGTRSGSGAATFDGHRFGRTLNNEKMPYNNPSNRAGAGIAEWQGGKRLGQDDKTDPSPAFNPERGS